MSQAATPDQEQRERQVRLMIIIGLAAVVMLAGLAVSIIGSRQVATRPTIFVKLRARPSSIQDSSHSPRMRPTPTRCRKHWAPIGWSLFNSRSSGRWCVETEVSALLSSETVFFVIDDDGRFVETPDCRR